jgi:signal-transduction protein with cAMP-binding, CBS, and nucleotidyltransferase domain
MTHDSALPTFRFARGTSIAQAQPKQNPAVTLDSPALDVMTDLTLVKAATTNPTTTLAQAEQMMIYQGVRLLFVVSDMPSVEGLVTATDLRGDKPMRIVHQRGLRHDDLRVADVMTELSALDAIDFAHMGSATVRNVIATLKKFGRQHLLVAQSASAQSPQRIRGVISKAQVERQLGTPIDLTEIASSFAEIGQALT